MPVTHTPARTHNSFPLYIICRPQGFVYKNSAVFSVHSLVCKDRPRCIPKMPPAIIKNPVRNAYIPKGIVRSSRETPTVSKKASLCKPCWQCPRRFYHAIVNWCHGKNTYRKSNGPNQDIFSCLFPFKSKNLHNEPPIRSSGGIFLPVTVPQLKYPPVPTDETAP